jgi:hypothetical protein
MEIASGIVEFWVLMLCRQPATFTNQRLSYILAHQIQPVKRLRKSQFGGFADLKW